ncbi:MAG: hypothetical protein M1836_004267 [Candelina mexicana]|nr:MAG: hypothetical protein M1836_004267 [Candelina mexicana]
MSSEDLFSALPTELRLSIFAYLKPRSLFAASQVSSQWRHLCDSIVLLQVKLKLPRLLPTTTHSTHNISAWSSQDVDNLLHQLPRISATDFFTNVPTFRTFGLSMRLLEDTWDGGRPCDVKILNSGRHRLRPRHAYHNAEITSVIIDAMKQNLITGDIEGLVICWNIKTGQKEQGFLIYEDPSRPHQRAMIGAMALRDNLLAIGCWINHNVEYPSSPKVQLHRRYPLSGGPSAFYLVGHFTVTSSVVSVKLEESVCIVTCMSGEIEFWRFRDANVGSLQSQSRAALVHAARALTINPYETTLLDVPPCQHTTTHYYKPCLYVFDFSMSRYHPRVPAGEQDLWDYPSSEIIRTLADRDTEVRSLAPPASHTYYSFPASFSKYITVLGSLDCGPIPVLEACSEKLAEGSEDTIAAIFDKTIRSLTAMPGSFAMGTQAVISPHHQLPSSQADVHLFHENGDEIAVFEDHHGDVNAVAIDPCFLVSVSDDLTIRLRDFRPRLSGYS